VKYFENPEIYDGGQAELDYLEQRRIDKETYKGYMWDDLVCENGHKVVVCIVTLIPCPFPYRSCDNCKTTCLANLAGKEQGKEYKYGKLLTVDQLFLCSLFRFSTSPNLSVLLLNDAFNSST